MKGLKKLKGLMTGLLVLVFTLVGAGIGAMPAQAASGTVYTAVIHPCYAHPVTGVIEDSGGEASYATGQGMVEGAIYTTGILEVTDSGEYYLTIRMSLMDYTSGHSFSVQNVGDSGWSATSANITGNGSDSNGTTADICMQVPSENCVVRGTMYVNPMGRDVIFYLYPSDYSQGNNTDMNATIVTESSAASNGGGAAATSGTAGGTTGGTNSGSLGSNATSGQTTGNSLQSSISQAAQPTAGTDGTATTDSEGLNSAAGLSLSTAVEEAINGEGVFGTVSSWIVIRYVCITISGLILIGAVALVVYFFRKNWYRWGGGGYDDDDEWELR
ncbi:MAG: heme-binding Shp domain-containing protein [Eubacterium sp.]|nr:heme-binding Shp domain-containing protein [Eubacterium sp.]